jgi:DNA invertase Pin-like site-specific DNA recombinase
MPCKDFVTRNAIKEMRQKGELADRPFKSEITREKVIGLYKSGVTNPYEIAKSFGLSPMTVRNILSHAKLNRERPKHNYKKREPRAYERLCDNTKGIIKLLNSGMTARQVARELDMSTQWVYVIKAKYIDKETDNEE